MNLGLETHLREVMNDLSAIPEAEWAYFWPQVQQRHFARGDHLFREGRAAADVHFIVSGLVRLYHGGDGTEFVRGFDFEGRFVAMYESVLTGCPSGLNVQALEPVHTLVFPGAVLLRLYDRHACWDRLGRRILEWQWVRRQDKEMRFRLHDPEAHYRLLLARGSPLIGRVPLKQLASYLRITPETLSRIRRRVQDAPPVEVA